MARSRKNDPQEDAAATDSDLPEVSAESVTDTSPPEIAEGHDAGERVEPPLTPAEDPPPREAASPPRRRGGFAGALLGGALAAVAGYGAAHYGPLKGLWPVAGTEATDIAALRAELATRDEALGVLRTEIAGLKAAPAAPQVDDSRVAAAEAAAADLGKRLDALSGSVDELRGTLGSIETRLTAIEERPAAEGGATIGEAADLRRQIDELRTSLAAQASQPAAIEERLQAAAKSAEERIAAAEAEAARLADEARTAAQRERAGAAISLLQANLETGAPIAGALAELAAAGIAVPPALADNPGGIPSLAQLRAAYPDAARAALTLSLRETAGEGFFDRAAAFLRSQTGARSLSPRAGDDPDAVLSRAEAALSAGDLRQTLSELEGLPQAGRDRMAEWEGLAKRRLDATDAVASLSEAAQ